MASPSRKRLLLLLAGMPVLMLISALIYMVGMAELEGEPRTIWQALSWAGETVTTTGYGGDASWRHPLMVLFVILLQLIGVFVIFLVFPIYLIPFLEERFEARLPQEATGARDHLIIYRYGPAVETLLDEAKSAGLDIVLIESDESRARPLFDAGTRVVARDFATGGLEAAGLADARALIANGSDDENAAVILAARQLGFAGDALALVEEPSHRKPMMLAGATAAYTPRHILGAALAARASARIHPIVGDLEPLGRKLDVAEIRIQPGSTLAGKTLAKAEVGARMGVTVIGQWVGGRLITEPTADMPLEANGILIAVGSAESLTGLSRLAEGTVTLKRTGHFVVGGFGEVGQKVTQLLRDAGEEVRVVDREAKEGVDFVGNILDTQILEAAGAAESQAVILALDTDSATLFTTVILKDMAPDVSTIARVNQAQNLERIYRAGADFALSLSQVSGRMLARRLLGEEVISLDQQLRLCRVEAEGLAGSHPTGLRIRSRTGGSVVAVERGDEVLVDFPPEFRFEGGDSVYLAGSQAAVSRFREEFGRVGRLETVSGEQAR